jgi:signal transduction histidine kinase
MKLFNRYTRINTMATILIFLLASIAYYFLLRYVIIGQLEDDLKIEQHEIEGYVRKFGKLPAPIAVKDQIIRYVEVSGPSLTQPVFSTVPSAQDRQESMRQLQFELRLNESWYLVTVGKDLEGTRAIIHAVILITLGVILVILLTSLLINRMLIRKLWQPFYSTLEAMRQYRIGQSERPRFSSTDIDEFQSLNATLNQSISRAEADFRHLKEFTENASHELQTPLAVVRSKLDILIQDETLSESQSRLVQNAYEAVHKLTRLNSSLLLLSKIENRQFEKLTTIRFDQTIEQKMDELAELLREKDFTIVKALEPVSININVQLADILLNNLFSNAIRHSPDHGILRLELNSRNFCMANTALGDSLDESKLFDRFYKGGNDSDHHGLGLSIAAQICQVSGISIQYQYGSKQHLFRILL